MTAPSSLDLPDDGDCPFCAYLRGERPYTIVYRTADTATLVTHRQKGDPHLLVIPVRHLPTVLELTDAEAAAVAVAVRDAARAIERAYAKPGIAVWQNNGRPAGQEVGHLHFHVAGTLPEGGTRQKAGEKLSLDETEAIARKLRSAR